MAKRGRKPQDPILKELRVVNSFNSVKQLMKYGYPKYIACKKLKIDKNWLDKNMTFEMKRMLDEIKYSFSQGSSYTKWKVESG